MIEKKNTNLRVIKISLFGINNLREINSKINAQVLEIGAKIVDSGKKTINSLIKNKTGLDLGLDGIDFLEILNNRVHKKQGNKKTYLLIFDDLERCAIPFDVILGYINNLNENFNFRTIVVANTKKISNSNLEIFCGYKEKLFSFTYQFESDFMNTANEIIESKIVIKNLRENASLLTNTYVLGGCRNLRTVIKIVDKINMLFSESCVGTVNIDNDLIRDIISRVGFYISQNKESDEKSDSNDKKSEGSDFNNVARKISDTLMQPDVDVNELFFLEEFCKDREYNLEEIASKLTKINERRVNNIDNPVNRMNGSRMYLMNDADFNEVVSDLSKWIEDDRISFSDYPIIIRVLCGCSDLLELFGNSEFIPRLTDLMLNNIESADFERIKAEELNNDWDTIFWNEHIKTITSKVWGAIQNRLDKDRRDEWAALDFSNSCHYDFSDKVPINEDLLSTLGIDRVMEIISNAKTNEEINNLRALIISYYGRNHDKRESDSLEELRSKLEEYLKNNDQSLEKTRKYMLRIFVDSLNGKHYGHR